MCLPLCPSLRPISPLVRVLLCVEFPNPILLPVQQHEAAVCRCIQRTKLSSLNKLTNKNSVFVYTLLYDKLVRGSNYLSPPPARSSSGITKRFFFFYLPSVGLVFKASEDNLSPRDAARGRCITQWDTVKWFLDRRLPVDGIFFY